MTVLHPGSTWGLGGRRERSPSSSTTPSPQHRPPPRPAVLEVVSTYLPTASGSPYLKSSPPTSPQHRDRRTSSRLPYLPTASGSPYLKSENSRPSSSTNFRTDRSSNWAKECKLCARVGRNMVLGGNSKKTRLSETSFLSVARRRSSCSKEDRPAGSNNRNNEFSSSLPYIADLRTMSSQD